MKTLTKKDPLFILSVLALCLSACAWNGPLSPTSSSSTVEPKEFFLQRLNDSLCRLPCWMGITPSVTSVDHVHEVFERLGADEIEFENSNGVSHHYTHELAYMTFQSSDGIVTDISVEIILNSLSDTLDDFLQFSAENVIENYGIPDEFVVLLERNVEPSSPQVYSILSFYGSQNFIVIERGVLENQAADFKCFDNQTVQNLFVISGSSANISLVREFWHGELDNPAYTLDFISLSGNDVNLFQSMQKLNCN